jgi:Zn/Cd-binding protein ZinT
MTDALVDLDRALIKKGGLKKFIELSWHQIEPGKAIYFCLFSRFFDITMLS